MSGCPWPCAPSRWATRSWVFAQDLIVERLVAASSYVEDVTSAQLSSALASGRYLPTTEPAQLGSFEVALITVPTPLREGGPDLTFVLEAGRTLAEHLNPGALVVLESTSYPGTTEELLSGLLNEACGLRAGEDFHLGTAPSASTPATPTSAWRRSPRSSPGVSAASLAAVKAFYDTMVHNTVAVAAAGGRTGQTDREHLPPCQYRAGEQFAMFAADAGVDVWEALPAAATKPFGFMRFNPGPGVGGHRLPIDPTNLPFVAHAYQRGPPFASSSWPTTSTTICPTTSWGAPTSPSTAASGRSQRQSGPPAGFGVQTQHLGHAGVSLAPGGPAPGLPRRPGRVRRRPRGRTRGRWFQQDATEPSRT